MKPTLKPGIRYEHRYRVPASKTVPALYPEAEEFLAMPEVFATGFLVGFLEWACIKAINPHLDWPREQTVGIHVNVSHSAATPPGMEVTASVELIAVEGKKLVFRVRATDGVDVISEGTHERFVIDRERFDAKVRAKAGQA
ncbi:thioesterase family protein [Ramlibacter sp.]|uniref:thioesterase family protein n=1 Tax=Ramlibacter sp. TaxID=1917967 RepID=UPI002D32154B|nr:thioesterase family protein [Ramlibacter sp.]HYD76039.1 thioesterase family protein [Ramlibacter sp.]